MKIKPIHLFCLLAFSIDHAWADVLPTLIDPNNPAKPAREVPKPLPQKGSAPEASSPTSDKASSSSGLTPDTMIKIDRLRFVGGTRYNNQTLAAPFGDLLGKSVPLKQLIAATQSITDRYHEDGYILSYAYIPAKNFQQGTLTIVLVEGYIANSRIQSDNTPIAHKLEKLARKMMEEKPLTKDWFERYSLLMNRIPDTKISASANNPDNIYGATVLDVKSEHPHYWNLSSTVDSRKDEQKALISGTLSGLTPYGEQLGLATMLPLGNSDNKENYFGLNYQQYLGDDGLQMQLRGSYYKKKPKKYTPALVLPQFDIDIGGKTDETQYTGGVQFNYPLILTRQRQWSVSGALDYIDKSYDEYYSGSVRNQPFSLNASSKLRYPAAEISSLYYREYTQAFWSTRFGVRQGIEGSVSNSNLLTPTDIAFTRWRMNTDVAYLLAEKWRLSTSIEGVWSDNDLPEPERASFGGLRYGRGYSDGDASGDYGYGGQIEMRYLYARESQWLNSIQPYVLVDTAHTYFNQPLLANRQLASYALGMTFSDSKHYSLSLEGARPIGDLPTDADKREFRFNATFTYNFNN